MRPDPVAIGAASFWKHKNASEFSEDQTFECDVVIIGSGAGGATAAASLARSGFKVIIVEEGPLRFNQHFTMEESTAYPSLYQEAMGRKTKGGGINILQGKSVGGSTTVNWTTSFRTPQTTLNFWTDHYKVKDATSDKLQSYFKLAERTHSVSDWKLPPNQNNSKLKEGCEKLGIKVGVTQRNVNGCANLGYCGVGCPIGAKQGSLVTTIPEAMKYGATLLTRAKAHKLDHSKGTINELLCFAVKEDGKKVSKVKISIKAQQFVLAAGAIGSPALVLRSELDDPEGLVGKRTFLHPTVGTSAVHGDEIAPYSGAPQSIYSDAFLTDAPESDPIGYKLETAPLHPVLSATVLQGHGQKHSRQMARLNNTSNIIALLRDGFHDDSQGGEVYLRSDDSAGLKYEFNSYLWDGVKRAYLTMAEILFASGAKWITPIHASSNGYASWNEAKREIPDLPYEMLEARVFSAHVMGGLAMGEDEDLSVVDSFGSYRYASNLTVVDGSIFPTSVGTNPQLSVYSFAQRNTNHLIKKLRNQVN